MEKEPILTVKDLSVSFHMYDTGLEQYDLKVISNLNLDVCPGEIVEIGPEGLKSNMVKYRVRPAGMCLFEYVYLFFGFPVKYSG